MTLVKSRRCAGDFSVSSRVLFECYSSHRSLIALFYTYMSLVYELLYLLLTTIASGYTSTYHWSTELTGLASLEIETEFPVGLVVIGSTSDKIIIKLTTWNGGTYEPEMRLPSMTLFAVIIPISFFWYGWTAEKAIHWTVPIIALAPFGFGMLGVFFPIQMYHIDAVPSTRPRQWQL